MLSSFFSLFSGENFTFLFVYFIWKLRNNSQGLGSAVGGKGETKIGEGEKEIGKGSESSVSLKREEGGIALSPPQSTIFAVSLRFLPFQPTTEPSSRL